MKMSGKFIISNTSGEEVRAFVPDPLPEQVEISEQTRLLLTKAELELGRLDLANELVPSHEWLLYGFVRKEAVVSSQIEGTQASLVDLFGADEAVLSENPDIEAVCNYLAAVKYSWGQLSSKSGLPISLRLIKEIHKRLLKGVRGQSKNPGEFRSSQNWIGGTRPSNAVFVPPPPIEMLDCLEKLEESLHRASQAPALLRVAMVHVQFETIHPFLDGNGRLGRLLIVLMMKQFGLISSPLLYLSLYFKTNRPQYYRLLNHVRETGDWQPWIEFFLTGIIEISQDVAIAAKKISQIISADRKLLLSHDKATVAAIRLMDELPRKPILTLTEATELLSLTKPPVSKAIRLLVELKILVETTGQSRDRIFQYKRYTRIIGKDTEPL